MASIKQTVQPFRLMAVWACGAFYFLYVGIEGESCFSKSSLVSGSEDSDTMQVLSVDGQSNT